MNRRAAFAAHVLSPLLVGGTIYLAWRSPSLLMFRWAEFAGINIAPFRQALSPYAPPSDLLVYSLPNALWAYAAVSFFGILWHQQRGFSRRAWITVACGLAVLPELAQAVQSLSGTFDDADLLTATIAVVFALWIHRAPGEPHVSVLA